MTGSIATTAATVVLAAGLGGGGRPADWTNGSNMMTTSTPIITRTTNSVFDSGQDSDIRLPLCSELNMTTGTSTSSAVFRRGGGSGGGRVISGTGTGSGGAGGLAILENSGIFGDNGSELIYGTDMVVGVGNNNELTIEDVKYLTYGILWPTICGLGIIGNILNLIVLNQPNMKGTAYIYMRGRYSLPMIIISVRPLLFLFLSCILLCVDVNKS